ncbi:MAG: RNA polymerase sigma factor (sigma-70 family) [Planctomycetota bacterium]
MICAVVYTPKLAKRMLQIAFAWWGNDNMPESTTGIRPANAPIDWFPMTEPIPKRDALLCRIANGDADAVGTCLERYGAMVWSLVRKAWKDVSTIEDLVQEIFIDVWKSAERFDPEKASEATFIATIARRRVIDRRRRISRVPEHELIEQNDFAREDDELSNVDLGDEAQLAREALAELKPDQRRVILMSVVDGLTHHEIAAETGIPLGTVKSHIRRGLDQTAHRLRSARGGKQ